MLRTISAFLDIWTQRVSLDCRRRYYLLSPLPFAMKTTPISVIESLCCGTPVLGRDIGGIPELLETDSSNRLFGRDEELPASITEMFQSASSVDRRELSDAALQRFSARRYYQKWREIAEEE